MNKSGQTGLIVFVSILGVFLLLLIGYMIGSNNQRLQGEIIEGDELNCQTLTISANSQVIGESSCSGKGNFLSSAKCTVKIKNTEQQLISVTPKFYCETMSGGEYVTAESKALMIGETSEFNIKWGNQGEDWKCSLTDTQATKTIEKCVKN